MSSERHLSLMGVAAAGATIASLYVVGKSLQSSLNRLRTMKAALAVEKRIKSAINNPFSSSVVVSSASQWETFYEQFSRDLADLPIIGFDCEWITLDGYVQPVALVQIASYRGACALVRLNKISTMPTTLHNLLSNRTILKVGVCTSEDATKLRKDFGIQTHGFYDLRHLLHQHPNFDNFNAPAGLSGLTKHFLEVDLNKHRDIRCSNWEAENLSEEQIKYAAQDALASLGLCLKLVSDIVFATYSTWNFQFSHTNEMFSHWFQKSLSLIDTKYKLRNKVPKPLNGTALTPKRPATGITDPSKLEKMSRGYAARKTPLYDNCILQAPDGQQLCTCDSKKAMWYVNKLMGEVVCESPFSVRLNFEPSGRPSSEYDYYYIIQKANVCVVCGSNESFLRKNIVPHEYRKHFPTFLKDHKSHDILLLCLTCHAMYNTHEANLKLELAILCKAPIGTEQDVKFKLDRAAVEVQCAANALIKNRPKMPQTRIEELEQKVKTYFQVDIIGEDVLQKAQHLETQILNSEFVPHGLKVVQFFEKEEDGLLNFEKRWREHFVETMEPRHLPELWSTSHSRKLTDKWGVSG